ncbi:molybdenum cofactor guanylyltransferase [Candidatus Bathyarchaeota archaeon]|nr:molybdenum cofactor guanylyltransferase [Candidatus Bathyarchaeota archaeon]
MANTAVILAGGESKRLGVEKGLLELFGKPLIRHIYERIAKLVDEVIIVVSTTAQLDRYAKIFVQGQVRQVVDENGTEGPLAGMITGFHAATEEYSLLLPCDTPFISKEVIALLLELRQGYDAVVPRWPNGYIEPLHAVYRTKIAVRVASEEYKKGRRDLRAVLERLQNVLYLSTLVIKEIDPKFLTFLNINNISDLKRVEQMSKKSASKIDISLL